MLGVAFLQGERMYIKSIVEENPNVDLEEVVSECSELIQVKKAIEKLDGEKKTAVILKKDDFNYMIVGGGSNNNYVVLAIIGNKRYTMSNKFALIKEPIEITVGKKTKSYLSRKVVNLEMVLQSAKHFASRGSLAQTFNWELG